MRSNSLIPHLWALHPVSDVELLLALLIYLDADQTENNAYSAALYVTTCIADTLALLNVGRPTLSVVPTSRGTDRYQSGSQQNALPTVTM
jgi:hypothetical protein